MREFERLPYYMVYQSGIGIEIGPTKWFIQIESVTFCFEVVDADAVIR